MVDFRDRVDKVLNICTNNFGEMCTLYPDLGGSYDLRGIFDNNFELVDPDTEQVISANHSVLGVNLFNLDFEVKTRDKVQIRNVLYSIYDIREDGQGGASLLLHRCKHESKVYKKKDI